MVLIWINQKIITRYYSIIARFSCCGYLNNFVEEYVILQGYNIHYCCSRTAIPAYFFHGGANPLSEGEQKEKELNNAKRNYLEEKAVELRVNPIALGFFGGCYDFNKMSWFFQKTLSSLKPKLESAGFKEIRPGVYDLRDIDAIRNWTKEISEM